MKKLLTVLLILVFAVSAAFSAQAQELEPFQVTDPCCYIQVGGTYEFQLWDTETSYKIADETIATIDESGVIHGLKNGHTTMDVVVFDEKFASWVAGGYSFTQEIEVYTVNTVMTLGDNIIENSATFTPDESGYYSFTGSDFIKIKGGTVEHCAAADFHDDPEYVPTPVCYLQAGVVYTVTATNYDETYLGPPHVMIAKSTEPPTTTKAPAITKESASPTTTANAAATAPQTGDSTNALLPSMMVLSGAALLFLCRKK